MTVLLSLYSCIHDEIYSSSDPSSTEYTNKSLWKQDEKYIKNVMKVYAENEADIKKVNGIPYWNYATTVDSFDESFVAIPVVDNGKVISVLKVPRHGKKIYFYYTHDESDLLFFQRLVFAKNKKAGMPDSSTAQTDGMACTRQWMSMWFPDSESNPDPGSGSGHWESVSIIKCEATKDECIGIALPNGDCDLSGGNEGGYPYPGGGGEGTEPEEEPCEKTKALVNNPALKSKIDSLKKFSLTAEDDEMGFQQDKSGNITPAQVNGKHYVEFLIDQNSLGGIHSHTLTGTHMFSPKDILSFLSFARVQNYTLPVGSTADYTGNAFVGMISQSGSYFITFNGGSGDLPPPMTPAEQEAFEAEMNDTYRNIIKDLLKAEGKSKGDTLSQQGLQKLFFDLIKKMGLEGKINLIQQDGSNTSTIQQNPDGTIKTPIPC
ncbi:MAG: hypothetical protein K0R36_2624 [Chryseobacterium sp.]|nr:hypothetical protein [Chryseobacterium sp.]